MSCEYKYVERKYISKYIKDTKYKISYEGYRIDYVDTFCNIFGLPEIPYYCCYEQLAFTSNMAELGVMNNDDFYLYISKINYLNNDRTIILENMQFPKNITKKRYLQYEHWQDWGLKKLSGLTVNVIKNKKQVKRKDIYYDEENINQIKLDILELLKLYKSHYYRLQII